MGLRSAAEFREGLRDGRVVYYRGERVEDVTTHHDLGIGVSHVALDFDLAEDLEHRDLMTWIDLGSGERVSRYFKIPTDSADLLNRREMIERSTRLGGAVVLLITDGLDRDAAVGLENEIERLHKSCRRLIWLNPLLRYDGFQPKALGIKTLLPHVDDFRTIHNLESLDDLAGALGRLGSRKEEGPSPWLKTAS